ncbi:glycosyltransferase [Vibrio apostichopi]|uniref:glycosyltransferase n=1 Tax=Vibrio apostichopi TaxID=3035453 RepID=UPI00257337B9|nr:glycosyltransferase [Vibrio sp. FE10]
MGKVVEVSVVLPVYNAEKYIHDAIESTLNQTYKDFELIIIDDGSTDRSLDIINSFEDERIVVVSRDNKGLVASLNEGVSLSKGKFIARMDADDINHPKRLEIQVKQFSSNKDLVLHCSNVRYIDSFGVVTGFSGVPLSNRGLKKKLRRGNCIFHPSVMFLKSAFDIVGGYDRVVDKYFEDYILWLDLSRKGDFKCSSKSLLDYRILTTSLSRNQPDAIKKIYHKVIRNYGHYPELHDDFKLALTDTNISKLDAKVRENKFLSFFTKFPKILIFEMSGLIK